MAKKELRDVIELAESLGLEVVEISDSKGHNIVKLKNADGKICHRTIHRGSITFPRDRMNQMAELRRFARGQYHGLRIEGEARHDAR